jgi:tetratricopeptide (TPR) repeat protein
VGIDPLLANQVGGDEQISNDKLQGMADQLSQRLADNPNNAEGWVMMGRIERALGEFDKADTAFKKALSPQPTDDVRIERAEVLAQKNQGKFDGEPWDIIHSVLKADPEHGRCLVVGRQCRVFARSVSRRLGLLEQSAWLAARPSPDLPALVEAINKARERLNLPPLDPETGGCPSTASTINCPAQAHPRQERTRGRAYCRPSQPRPCTGVASLAQRHGLYLRQCR